LVRGFYFQGNILGRLYPAFTLWIGRFVNCHLLAELATMIPEQLDLFGGTPKPPQKIRVEETPQPAPITEPARIVDSQDEIPDWIEEVTENLASETLVEDHEPEPISEVIAWMEPGDHEPSPARPEPPIVPTSAIVIELPAQRKTIAEEELEPVAIASLPESTVTQPSSGEEPGIQQLNIPPDEILFKRQYYSMRETAAMFDISHSMLRYWENEFDILQPRKNRKGDRYFRPIDIKNLQLIYHLLKVRKFTLDGAGEYLRNHNKALDTFELIQKLEKVKSFLHELKAHL
jgi:DNA-binding transcriptional MerR regulator